MSPDGLSLSAANINQPIQYFSTGQTAIRDVTILRKKAKDYAEETRALLLKGVTKKESTKHIQPKVTRSSYELASKAINPRIIPNISKVNNNAVVKSDEILSATKATASMDKGDKKDNSEENGSKKNVQSLYDLDRVHCDAVRCILDGSDPDLSWSIRKTKSTNQLKKDENILNSSILLYTPFQKTPALVLSDIEYFSSEADKNDCQIAEPDYSDFSRNKFNFYNEFTRLCEYEQIHQKNIVSLVSRNVDTVKTETLGCISDDELLQMVYSLVIHIDGKRLVNQSVTQELRKVFMDAVEARVQERQIVLKLKLCTKNLAHAELVPLKAILGHLRRIAIVYGYHKSIRGLSSIFSDLIFSGEKCSEKYYEATPIEMHEIIFKRNGPQNHLSAILEMILYYYNIFF